MFDEKAIRVVCVNGHETTFIPLEGGIADQKPIVCCACRGRLVALEDNLHKGTEMRRVSLESSAFMEYEKKITSGVIPPQAGEYEGICESGHSFQIRCPETLEELLLITVCPVCEGKLASLEDVGGGEPGERTVVLSLSAVINHLEK